MKQKWLVTATDISAVSGGSTPTNFRDDAVAFGLNVTCTGQGSPGSLWVEYNVEFASPRVPEPVVNASFVNNVNSGSLADHSGFKCPVGPGEMFYVAASQGQPDLGAGYTAVNTGTTDGVSWTLVKRAENMLNSIWGNLTGLSTTISTVMASENLTALIKLYKRIRV